MQPTTRHSSACYAGVALLLALCPACSPAGEPPAEPRNLVTISPQIVTSGQPSAAWLEGLKAQGFDAVIYLAPPTVPDAVREEPLIVGRQGLVFVNIPIEFEGPDETDLERFTAIMDSLAAQKVLVHCQINLRASSMVFLYRVLAKQEDARAAYKAVRGVWTPAGPWKAFIQAQLQKHTIDFDPFGEWEL